MADEIRKLDGNGVNRNFLFLYPIDPPKTYTVQGGSTNTIVPTPAPTEGLISDVLTTPEKNALDSGDSGYESISMRLNDADLANDAVLIPQLQAEYALKKAAFLAMIDSQYNRTGDKFDEA